MTLMLPAPVAALAPPRYTSYWLGVTAYRNPDNRGLTCGECWQHHVVDGVSNLWRSEFWRGWYHASDNSLTDDDLERLSRALAAPAPSVAAAVQESFTW